MVMHKFDVWFFCKRCGLSDMQAHETVSQVCESPDAAELAKRQLNAIVARAPLVEIRKLVIARLEDSGVLP